MKVSDLRTAPHWISTLARWHFKLWGSLTGSDTLVDYINVLTSATTSDQLPRVLIAERDGNLLGSANLVACDCHVHPELSPWLAQLFVDSNGRKLGVGKALVRAAQDSARSLGFPTLYLFTSGTLPTYYQAQGWTETERFLYLGKERALMQYDLSR